MSEAPRHILSADDFTRAEIEGLHNRAEMFDTYLRSYGDRSPFT